MRIVLHSFQIPEAKGEVFRTVLFLEEMPFERYGEKWIWQSEFLEGFK